MREHQRGAGRRGGEGRVRAPVALVGRDTELATVRRLLASGRLLSVVGAAGVGVGKSSVARAAATRPRACGTSGARCGTRPRSAIC
ncbi:hypothetical protein [Streptomyces luteolus]|uniref:Orc1-like AAA ATPase domain-containing protein n=1 Tax=Streptomyces luteolus TaxID=3043615 RepID=A0ABT6T3G3_9ACTN|nr:hypothetical protein [Streptomyces sp. B-S-A12]MDI3421584.1 hypothetical protein [Streptomyces sp. B-S-A12]